MIPVLLSDRNERPREAQAVARMIPAQQRLGAAGLAGEKAHLRLEDELELASLRSFGQRLLGIDLVLVVGGKSLAKQPVLAAPGRFGAVHGDVGGPHQRFDAVAMLGA